LVTDTQPSESRSRRPIRAVAGYGLMVGFTIVVFLLIRSYGEGLVAPPRAQVEPVATSAQRSGTFLRVLVALTAIIVTGQVLCAMRRIDRMGGNPYRLYQGADKLRGLSVVGRSTV
jgi:hypothetical protein